MSRLFTILLSCFIATFAYSKALTDTVFKTYSLDAAIHSTAIVPTEISTCMDSKNRTHIVYSERIDEIEHIMYTLFDPISKTFSTPIVVDPDLEADIKTSSHIQVDKNDNPHIVFHIKRDADVGTRESNYAIMYAGYAGGGFTVSQVSTNSDDLTTTDPVTIYDSYLVVKPKVFFIDGVPAVSYESTSDKITGWNNHMIIAEKNGTGWTRTQEYQADSKTYSFGTYSEADGSVTAAIDPMRHFGFIEISDYSPIYTYNINGEWASKKIEGYDGIFNNDHPQIISDNAGTIHYLWYNEERNGEETNQFCHTTLDGDTYTTVTHTPVIGKPSSSNFYPSTVDKEYSTPVFVYLRAFKGYYIILDGQEYLLPDADEPYGMQTLQAQGGNISYVSFDEDKDLLYITVNENSSTPAQYETNIASTVKNVAIYPQPANESIYIATDEQRYSVEIYNMANKLLHSQDITGNEPISVRDFPAGMYMLQLKLEKETITKRFTVQ